MSLALFLLGFVSSAMAGPPNHVRTPELDIAGFNHACGAAVDSKGDVYVASAGESKIRVFDPEHDELTSISNANEPCGLAVDTKGNLYVSEQATGNVIKYTPNAYPFAGTPSYGAPVTIDSSGEAKGISIDPTDDRLFVAAGDRIAIYNSNGLPESSSNEVQNVRIDAAGGTYALSFRGQVTVPLAFNAPSVDPGTPGTVDSVQEALEALSTVGKGNVSVVAQPPGGEDIADHKVIFAGALQDKTVPQLVGKGSALTGGGTFYSIFINTLTQGFSGSVGKGDLTAASGVAVHTYASGDRYVLATDTASDEIQVFSGADIKQIELRRSIDGVDHDRDPETPDQALGFGSEGAYLAADPGNEDPGTGKCASIAEQACTAGHFLVYDHDHEAVDEFEANGRFLNQLASTAFTDAEPTGLAVERSGGPNDGSIYVTAGNGAGAELLAFAPLAPPSRALRPDLSLTLANACGVAVDAFGNRYVAADKRIYVSDPSGKEIEVVGTKGEAGLLDPLRPCELAVDSECNVYALEQDVGAAEAVAYFKPNSCPPKAGTKYSGPTIVATGAPPYFAKASELNAFGLNPVNDHVYVNQFFTGKSIELASAKEGSAILDPEWASGLELGAQKRSIGGCGADGNVYVDGQAGTVVYAVDPSGSEVLARITGEGSLKGAFDPNTATAVDPENCHVVAFEPGRGVVEEYESSGAFVAEFGSSTVGAPIPYQVAVDSSGGPNDGFVYVAFDDTAPGSFDLTAYGPLSYGEAPQALTGIASSVGGGNATLNGTVDPRGFELEDCRFQYTSEADFQANEFSAAEEAPCAESLAAIGKGTAAVPVHADVSGLDPEGRYRFRLVAENKYGPSEGDPGLFGPPVLLSIKSALPVSYEEATLRARIDPAGLATKYHFEYGTSEAYGQSTPPGELPASAGPTDVEVPVTGLTDGTTYHFRIVLENEAKALAGTDQTLSTLERPAEQSCPNVEFRVGLSANLPECRAYELITPADTQGLTPRATSANTHQFNNWLVVPRGELAGDRLSYFVGGTLQGFDGNGQRDGLHAQRAAGAHPSAGWVSELFSPTYQQSAPDFNHTNTQEGVSSDQRYSLWSVNPLEGTLAAGVYLRTPAGFEALGRGSLGTDLKAFSHYVSPGGAHVLFSSDAHLEEAAPPAGTDAVYERVAGEVSSQIISVDPDGVPFATDATFLGSVEDGEAIAFKAGGTIYLRQDGETVTVAANPNTFAGISEDGGRVFYVDAAAVTGKAVPPATGLWTCEIQTGPCAGPEATQAPTQIAPNARFVNVSADGSAVYFTSTDVLDDASEGILGENNFYLWDAASETTRFLAVLDPKDLVATGFQGSFDNLVRWPDAIGNEFRRGLSPTRSTPDGSVLLFQSHAQLSAYENEGETEVYRYDSEAAPGKELLCVSCDPSGAPPNGEASLQELRSKSTVTERTLIPNVTDDGGTVFFQSEDPLLPEDANTVTDVYEWQAPGVGGCKREGGCLALISSGQGEADSLLYSMTPDGSDVFFTTKEKLVGQDIAGSPSIYDARVEGGIPDPPAKEPCQGDSCQGNGTVPPSLQSPPSSRLGEGGNTSGEEGKKARCPKGKRKVRQGGKTRCVRRQAKRERQKRSHRNGRAGR